MEVEELLSFKFDKPGTVPSKRKKVDDNNENAVPKNKRKGALINHIRGVGAVVTEDDRAKIVKMVDEHGDAELIDETNLKKLLLSFEKKCYKNQEMRIKFPDLPEKFLESEVELNDVIQEMHVIGTKSEHYQVLVDLNTVQSLLQLLSHDNTDISIAVVDLLQELTDVDTLNENDDGGTALTDALLEGQIVAVLVQNLERLDETVKEEAEGVHNSLAIIENITEFRPDICSEAAQQGLLSWLLKRIKSKIPFDDNKVYASEILAILLQNTDENRILLGEVDGIDVLLSQLAAYKRHDPSTKEEIEYMENLFDAMCSCLMVPQNRNKFLKGEGLQLMNLMLREKRMSRNSALKVLNHSMTGSEGSDNCQKFIDILGLRTIFPLFMKSPKPVKEGQTKDEMEEHVTSIVASLLKNCQGTQRQRLLNKYTENDHEKVERLVELHLKYLDRVRTCDNEIEQEKVRYKKQGKSIDSDLDDEFYLKRLDSGLFTLQLVDYIMLEVCSSGEPSVKQRVMQILNMRGGSVKAIRYIMREYAGNIGDAKDDSTQEAEQDRILKLVDQF